MANTKTAAARAIGTGGPVVDDGDAPEWATGGDQVATREVHSGEVARVPPVIQTLIDWCASYADEDDDSTAEGLARIIREVLEAEDMAGVLSAKLPKHARDVLGVPMQLNGFKLVESDFEGEDGFPWYAVMEVQYGNPPEPHVVTCGGVKILAQLKRLSDLGEIPCGIKIEEKAKPTKNGFRPLSLVPPM